jgi:hypothetical protein
MVKINPLRGQSSVKVEGEEYLLEASFNNMVAWQTACGVEGLPALMRLLSQVDPRCIMAGLESLAIKGDTSVARNAPFFKYMNPVQEALLAAIDGAIEKDAGGNGNGEAE